MRTISLLALGCVVGSLAATSALGQPFTFTRIVDTQTQIPGAPVGQTFQEFGAPSLSGDRLAFVGVRQPLVGVYEWNMGALVAVADSTTPVPQGSGMFATMASTANSGDTIVFAGGNTSVQGIYQRRSGVLGRVVDSQMIAPNGGAFSGGSSPTAEGDTVAFFARHKVGSSNLPAVYRWDSGTITTVADTDTPVPGGTGNFQDFFSTSVRLDQGAVWFRGPDTTNKQGIYKRDENGLHVMVNTNSDGPVGEGKFTGLGAFGVDGDDLLFNGATETNPASSYFTRINGEVLRLVSNGDPAPGGGTFSGIGNLTLNGGIAVFTDGNIGGIYTNFGGTLQRILGNGDMLDGQEVFSAAMVPNGRDGNRLAIAVTFNGHAPPENFDQAIYLVTLPAPGALLPFGVAALLAARRSR